VGREKNLKNPQIESKQAASIVLINSGTLWFKAGRGSRMFMARSRSLCEKGCYAKIWVLNGVSASKIRKAAYGEMKEKVSGLEERKSWGGGGGGGGGGVGCAAVN